ncbi:MAG: tetratricopeptide repeat protein [Chitinophagaceae bacterium]|nr:MAG: tetratricopeptide repeat protein [Chitinophagaceae bacterium]
MNKFLLFVMFSSISLGLIAQTPKVDSLRQLLTRSAADTHRVNLLRTIGNHIAAQDPSEAIGFWKQGVALSKSLHYDLGLARCYINLATGFSYLGKMDSSVTYSDTAIYYCKKIGDPSKLALVYLNRADNYVNLNNATLAIRYCDTALTYAEQVKDLDRVGRINSILGSVYSHQQQFPIALTYYHKALDMFREDENLPMVAQCYSEIATIFNGQGATDSALNYFKQAIALAEESEDLVNLATYNLEYASVLEDHGRLAEAKPYVQKALVYATQQGNNGQLSNVYSHFCNIHTLEGNFPAAIKNGILSYEYANRESGLNMQQQSALFLSTAYSKAGDFDKALEFLEKGKLYSDSSLTQQFNSEIATLQSNFEISQKDRVIALLNKEYQLQQQRLRQQRYVLAGSAILAVLAIVAILLLVNRYRLRQRVKEMQLRNRIAADLHDEVGSSLSSIHLLSQVVSQTPAGAGSRDEIMTRVSTNARETMDRMEDIVWMIKDSGTNTASLPQRMEHFIYEMCESQQITCNFTGQHELERMQLSMQQQKNIYLVFKEALNNSVKYSGSKLINIDIVARAGRLTMEVRDYGQGFDLADNADGNGLANMKNRATEMKGELDIRSGRETGTTIALTIPV